MDLLRLREQGVDICVSKSGVISDNQIHVTSQTDGNSGPMARINSAGGWIPGDTDTERSITVDFGKVWERSVAFLQKIFCTLIKC